MISYKKFYEIYKISVYNLGRFKSVTLRNAHRSTKLFAKFAANVVERRTDIGNGGGAWHGSVTPRCSMRPPAA